MYTENLKIVAAVAVVVASSISTQCWSENNSTVIESPDVNVSDYPAYVNKASHLNIRSGPGITYPVLQTLDSETRVLITHHNNGWARLDTSEYEYAYVSLSYMGAKKQARSQNTYKRSFSNSIRFLSHINIQDVWQISSMAVLASLSPTETATITAIARLSRRLASKTDKSHSR